MVITHRSQKWLIFLHNARKFFLKHISLKPACMQNRKLHYSCNINVIMSILSQTDKKTANTIVQHCNSDMPCETMYTGTFSFISLTQFSKQTRSV